MTGTGIDGESSPTGKYSLASVGRALNMLVAVGAHDQGIGLTELSKSMGLNKAVAYRILMTLMAENFVVQDEASKRYRLGPRLISLGRQAQRSTDLVAVAREEMRRLSVELPVVAYLTAPTENRVLILERIPRVGSLSMVPYGETMPLHACASGYLFLAYGGELLFRQVTEPPLQRFASGTVTESSELRAIISAVKKDGYALDRNTLQEGIASVAAPIRESNGAVVAAIGLSLPVAQLDTEGPERLVDAVIEATKRIGESIG